MKVRFWFTNKNARRHDEHFEKPITKTINLKYKKLNQLYTILVMLCHHRQIFV